MSPSKAKPPVGLLAMQGAYKRHGEVFSALRVPTLEVRTREELKEVQALVIPGGESTSMYKLLQKSGLWESLGERIESGMPVMATCAGIILLAGEITNFRQPILGALDISVERNAYGRQTDSFEMELKIKSLGEQSFPGIFIRAPKITRSGANVEVLAEIEKSPVLIRERNIMAATFHPELTDDMRIHELFIESIK